MSNHLDKGNYCFSIFANRVFFIQFCRCPCLFYSAHEGRGTKQLSKQLSKQSVLVYADRLVDAGTLVIQLTSVRDNLKFLGRFCQEGFSCSGA